VLQEADDGYSNKKSRSIELKVALVYDWITGMRGGDRVLETFCKIYPEAPIFTLVHIPGSSTPFIDERTINTSFIQRLPFAKKHYRAFLPLFPLAVESFDLRDYDIVISISSCVSKGVITSTDTLHLSYIFTPMRYIWDMFNEYFGPGRCSPLKSWMFSIAAHYLRIWDTASAHRVDKFIAISHYVAKRVKKYYNRDSAVIYPPVDCGRFSISESGPKEYYLLLSAFAPYKRLDIALAAFTELGLPLKVVGSGQDEKRLKAMGAPNIEFLGHLSDKEVAGLYSGCRALVFPGEEDFGITPLEAMASGRPVIAFAGGGALETVVPLFKKKGGDVKNSSPTGLFFYEQTASVLAEAVRDFEKFEKEFNPLEARARAGEFSLDVFRKNIKKTVTAEYKKFLKTGKNA